MRDFAYVVAFLTVAVTVALIPAIGLAVLCYRLQPSPVAALAMILPTVILTGAGMAFAAIKWFSR